MGLYPLKTYAKFYKKGGGGLSLNAPSAIFSPPTSKKILLFRIYIRTHDQNRRPLSLFSYYDRSRIAAANSVYPKIAFGFLYAA